MELNIKGKDIKLKYTFRSLLIFERLAGKTFQPTGLNDIAIYFFSCILAVDRESDLTFDDFIDWLDDNPQAFDEFSNWLTGEYNHQKELKDSAADEELKKKKRTPKKPLKE